MSENYLKELIDNLVLAEIDFIICGGVAAVLQGVERMTLDLDISIDFEPTNLNRFLVLMEAEGFLPRAPVPATVLQDPEIVRRMVQEKHALVFTFVDPAKPFRQIDVFLAPEGDYHSLIASCDQTKIGESRVRVLSKPQLLAMKRRVDPSREKDLMDIRALERLMGDEDGT